MMRCFMMKPSFDGPTIKLFFRKDGQGLFYSFRPLRPGERTIALHHEFAHVLRASRLLENSDHIQTLGVQVVSFAVFEGSIALRVHRQVPKAIPLRNQPRYLIKRRWGRHDPFALVAVYEHLPRIRWHIDLEEERFIAGA